MPQRQPCFSWAVPTCQHSSPLGQWHHFRAWFIHAPTASLSLTHSHAHFSCVIQLTPNWVRINRCILHQTIVLYFRTGCSWKLQILTPPAAGKMLTESNGKDWENKMQRKKRGGNNICMSAERNTETSKTTGRIQTSRETVFFFFSVFHLVGHTVGEALVRHLWMTLQRQVHK